MSDTPRTDIGAFQIRGAESEFVPVEIARQLERELAEARKEIARFRDLKRDARRLADFWNHEKHIQAKTVIELQAKQKAVEGCADDLRSLLEGPL